MTVLARGLHALGYSVDVATMYGGGPLEHELTDAGIPVHALGKRGRWDVAGFSRALLTLVRTLQPDIIHSYLIVPNLVAVALRTSGVRSKIVWGVRASDVQWKEYDWTFRASFELSRVASRAAHLIIANSEAGRRFHAASGYPANRMVVVPNGIDSQHFAPRPHARAAMRQQWGIDQDAPVVGLVGRLDPMKGHETFLRAAAIVRQSVPEARFLVIGDGPAAYASELRQLAESLGIAGRVHWMSAHRDVRDTYAALDALVSLSLWGEGFPNVIAEAMSTGTPCIVTQCGDSALVVGDTGVVLPSTDADTAASGMINFLLQNTDTRAELGRRARTRIVEQFSIDRLVADTEAALMPLLTTD